jgi:dihydrofolate reductase
LLGRTTFEMFGGTLVRALLRDGLVDQLHLFVYPVGMGAGRRLWGEGSDSTRLALKAHEAHDDGVVHLDYGPG